VIQDEVCTVALKGQGLFLSIRKSMRWRQNLKSVLEARIRGKTVNFHWASGHLATDYLAGKRR
jgi:hypothetical protein